VRNAELDGRGTHSKAQVPACAAPAPPPPLLPSGRALCLLLGGAGRGWSPVVPERCGLTTMCASRKTCGSRAGASRRARTQPWSSWTRTGAPMCSSSRRTSSAIGRRASTRRCPRSPGVIRNGQHPAQLTKTPRPRHVPAAHHRSTALASAATSACAHLSAWQLVRSAAACDHRCGCGCGRAKYSVHYDVWAGRPAVDDGDGARAPPAAAAAAAPCSYESLPPRAAQVCGMPLLAIWPRNIDASGNLSQFACCCRCRCRCRRCMGAGAAGATACCCSRRGCAPRPPPPPAPHAPRWSTPPPRRRRRRRVRTARTHAHSGCRRGRCRWKRRPGSRACLRDRRAGAGGDHGIATM
jgi:hypothetical protein